MGKTDDHTEDFYNKYSVVENSSFFVQGNAVIEQNQTSVQKMR